MFLAGGEGRRVKVYVFACLLRCQCRFCTLSPLRILPPQGCSASSWPPRYTPPAPRPPVHRHMQTFSHSGKKKYTSPDYLQAKNLKSMKKINTPPSPPHHHHPLQLHSVSDHQPPHQQTSARQASGVRGDTARTVAQSVFTWLPTCTSTDFSVSGIWGPG